MKAFASHTVRVLRAVIAFVLWSACEHLQAAVTPDVEKLASANSSFGFGLMKQLVAEEPNANVFISPYSVSAALQMVWQGAAGDTKKEMDRALALDGFKPESVGPAYKDLERTIKSASSNALLSIANSIWYAPNIQLKPQFVSLNQNFYGAKLSALDFTDPRSAGVVNAWVNDQTHSKIKEIVQPPLSSMTGAFLANAIYFKGAWEHKFNRGATHDEPFHLTNLQQKNVPMMRDNHKFRFQENPDFQAVRLPYAGGRIATYVFLPATNLNPVKLVSSLSSDLWQSKILPAFEERDGLVVMPRFKLEFRADLIQTLKAVGVRKAFDQTADFSGISQTPLFISAVEHATFIDVTEEGTEAAAATGITAVTNSIILPELKPFQMIVDRPFFLLMEDGLTRSILFMGIVNDPASQ